MLSIILFDVNLLETKTQHYYLLYGLYVNYYYRFTVLIVVAGISFLSNYGLR